VVLPLIPICAVVEIVSVDGDTAWIVANRVVIVALMIELGIAACVDLAGWQRCD
jgi:hypothetical protein